MNNEFFHFCEPLFQLLSNLQITWRRAEFGVIFVFVQSFFYYKLRLILFYTFVLKLKFTRNFSPFSNFLNRRSCLPVSLNRVHQFACEKTSSFHFSSNSQDSWTHFMITNLTFSSDCTPLSTTVFAHQPCVFTISRKLSQKSVQMNTPALSRLLAPPARRERTLKCLCLW